jgi:pimeloyl-ACP methyl ester carboxylesterase
MTTPADRLTSYSRSGLTFDVRDEGPADGQVVVLLHGFPQDSSSWDQLAPLLHTRGFRTVAPDQRG